MVDRSHSFEAIPLPEDGYTVSYLKDVAQQAKIYIRPSQRDLSLAQLLSTNFVYIYCISHPRKRLHDTECVSKRVLESMSERNKDLNENAKSWLEQCKELEEVC